jgi:CDP-glucose 4,6-dehydratase
LQKALLNCNPDVIIHLAAQSLVLTSYEKPFETFEINVNGTLNILEAARSAKNLKALLVVTTDKVYKNLGTLKRYKESDELGGDDPYSASKAMADILTQSWQKSVSTQPIGIARAGNVIGGGDYSDNRIIPNLIDDISKGLNPSLRHPDSVRPWQNVLDCLNGYISAVNSLIENQKSDIWNFGPDDEVCRTVSELTDFVIQQTNPSLTWRRSDVELPEESKLLLIDSTKARKELNWREKYDFESSVVSTVNWYKKSDQISTLEYMHNEISTFNLL